ncbi:MULTISPECIES: DUF4251 domain-containing protein [unclassified Kaistella]|uniref:DUF4251 domain-containing protein n=1 Tax=unclassified Kaistella TaxID=2762626 RepID=UPI00273677C3|nr:MULTISPECIES: DUF4251 domain-containing protein [unclassified Kaistella]MDP2452794.1 DUF4251 domain-containing protein [Kaistella sp. SH11-4b]MDP2455703.1 DUF4251 domain-containing protein [Kaistella sp. SH40-3]MDP2458607.1 DUF4251 domain-containing protein [Kaistella sp. SH19-2b]
MRNLSSIIVYVVLLSMTISCNVKNNAISKKVVYPLQTENFSFIATEREQDGFNYNIEEIKQNGNSWNNPPNFRERKVFVSPKSAPLDSGYKITVTTDELMVTLPAFYGLKDTKTSPSGTIQDMTWDYRLIHFTSSDFTVDKTINKKGNTALTIIAKDSNNPITIKMEVFKDGKTNVVFEPGDQKSTSYFGYVRNKNVIAKK